MKTVDPFCGKITEDANLRIRKDTAITSRLSYIDSNAWPKSKRTH